MNELLEKAFLKMALRVVFLVTISRMLWPGIVSGQEILKEFQAPGSESRGLAWDGEYLWCADVGKDSIFKIDPTSGQVVHTISFNFDPTYGGGITWSGDGALWATKVQYFRKLNAITGEEIANFHCPGG